MKLFYLIFLFSFFVMKGQNPCTPTNTPGQIYYSGTSSVATLTPGVYQYLCGPQTVLYDTIGDNHQDYLVYANSSSTLFLKAGTNGSHFVWLKSGSILNILSANSGANITFESGAIINNPYGATTFTTLCNNIIFPITNCVVGINEISKMGNEIKIYPNPINNKLFIEQNNAAKISITNYLGQTVYVLNNPASKQEIDLSSFSKGIYYLNVQDKIQQKVFKVIKE